MIPQKKKNSFQLNFALTLVAENVLLSCLRNHLEICFALFVIVLVDFFFQKFLLTFGRKSSDAHLSLICFSQS